MATLTLKGNNSGVLADPLDLTAAQVKTLLAIGSGDVSGLGALALLAQVDTAQIANLAVVTGKLAANAVLNGKLAQMATLTLKGNNSGVLADPLDLTAAQVKTLLAITGADHADGMGVMLVPNTADVIACCLNGGATASTLAGAVDRMDIYQFFCGRGVTVSGMKTSISTGVAAATVKLQLYDTNTNGRPTTLLGETGAISAAIAGIAGAVFAGGNVVLTAGKTYFVGIRHSSTASHDCWSANSVPHLNAGVASIAARAVFRRAGMTFALGATNPWGYAASEINTANPAALWLTVA